MKNVPKIQKILTKIQKLEIGNDKKTRMNSFVRKAFRTNQQDKINLKKLSRLSRRAIQHEVFSL